MAAVRQCLLADPYLAQALLLLYGHEATHQLVVVLDAVLAENGDESAPAQYREYFAYHPALPGLRVAPPPVNAQGLALCPVWSDPAAYLHAKLQEPVAQ